MWPFKEDDGVLDILVKLIGISAVGYFVCLAVISGCGCIAESKIKEKVKAECLK